jgi:hypothetical protein
MTRALRSFIIEDEMQGHYLQAQIPLGIEYTIIREKKPNIKLFFKYRLSKSVMHMAAYFTQNLTVYTVFPHYHVKG